jgi:hypothetical protein
MLKWLKNRDNTQGLFCLAEQSAGLAFDSV